jgi:hypothetical protein
MHLAARRRDIRLRLGSRLDPEKPCVGMKPGSSGTRDAIVEDESGYAALFPELETERARTGPAAAIAPRLRLCLSSPVSGADRPSRVWPHAFLPRGGLARLGEGENDGTSAPVVWACFPRKSWRLLNRRTAVMRTPYARWCGRGGIARCPLSRLTAAARGAPPKGRLGQRDGGVRSSKGMLLLT